MNRYIAYVVQRDGVQRYLVGGELTDDSAKATRHYYPSGARRAIKDFALKHPNMDMTSGVIDSRDPERIVP